MVISLVHGLLLSLFFLCLPPSFSPLPPPLFVLALLTARVAVRLLSGNWKLWPGLRSFMTVAAPLAPGEMRPLLLALKVWVLGGGGWGESSRGTYISVPLAPSLPGCDMGAGLFRCAQEVGRHGCSPVPLAHWLHSRGLPCGFGEQQMLVSEGSLESLGVL